MLVPRSDGSSKTIGIGEQLAGKGLSKDSVPLECGGLWPVLARQTDWFLNGQKKRNFAGKTMRDN